VYFDSASSSRVPGGEGDKYLETSDFLLRWLRQDTAETDNRRSRVLADRLVAALRKLDATLGEGRGRPSRADAPVPLLRYVQRAVAQAEWETVIALDAALAQSPSVSITYKGTCRTGMIRADDLLDALVVLLDAVGVARHAEAARKSDHAARKGAKPVESRHEREARERRERRSLRAVKGAEDEKSGLPTPPDLIPSRDPDDDGRTGEEPVLTYRRAVYARFASKRYGRVDRDKLGKLCADQQLDAFEAAVRHGMAMSAVGESSVVSTTRSSCPTPTPIGLGSTVASRHACGPRGQSRRRPQTGMGSSTSSSTGKGRAHGGGHI
jgi:hypothetical protein